MSEFGTVEVTSTPAEICFFKALALLKLEIGLHFHIDSEFRHTFKNFEGGLPKNILEKNTVLWKKGVEIWAFDGMAMSVMFFVWQCIQSTVHKPATPMKYKYDMSCDAQAVFRIHDILGWIRIRILGSMLLTNGSGSGSWIRILLFSSLTFKMPAKN